MVQADTFDAVTIEALRRVGGVKWSLFPDKIGAFVAEMDFGTAPAVAQALHSAVDVGMVGYLPSAWSDQMAQAYVTWAHAQYDWDVRPEHVRPLADVLAGLQMTLTHFCEPGAPVILPTPAYMPFVTLPVALGHPVIEVPLVVEGGRYVYDVDVLDGAFRSGGRLLILCNPHNPAGRVLDRGEMAAIAEVVDRYDGRVFADEIHAPLVYPGHQHVPYASISEVTAGHTITAASASKAWNLPGLKCAQAILSNDLDAKRWADVGMMAEHGASTLGVIANTAAYTAGGQWLAEVVAYLDTNRQHLGTLLAEKIPQIGYSTPEGTYLAWLDCRSLGLGDHPSEYFLEHGGTAMTDGALCGDAGKGFARFNFALPRPILEQAVDQMADAVARLGAGRR